MEFYKKKTWTCFVYNKHTILQLPANEGVANQLFQDLLQEEFKEL